MLRTDGWQCGLTTSHALVPSHSIPSGSLEVLYGYAESGDRRSSLARHHTRLRTNRAAGSSTSMFMASANMPLSDERRRARPGRGTRRLGAARSGSHGGILPGVEDASARAERRRCRHIEAKEVTRASPAENGICMCLCLPMRTEQHRRAPCRGDGIRDKHARRSGLPGHTGE